MEKSSKLSERIFRNSEKLKLKYRYDSNRLKGNRKILEAKIFSPQRDQNTNSKSREIFQSSYSLNSPEPKRFVNMTGSTNVSYSIYLK